MQDSLESFSSSFEVKEPAWRRGNDWLDSTLGSTDGFMPTALVRREDSECVSTLSLLSVGSFCCEVLEGRDWDMNTMSSSSSSSNEAKVVSSFRIRLESSLV